MKIAYLEVSKLQLDLQNYRTVPQKSEVSAIHALIAIDTEWFWALLESLVDDGYLATENIIVIKQRSKNVVKEGNRRVAAMKIIFGYVPRKSFPIPTVLLEKLKSVGKDWQTANRQIPCAVYDSSEAAVVDKIVTLTHGKGEQAGRAKWKAIARARHNRDENHTSEPALDLLEKYFATAKNVTSEESERWAGDFPLTVLAEAIRLIAPRIGKESAKGLADSYPNIPKHRSKIDKLIHDIGTENLDFKTIRDSSLDFGATYGLPLPAGSAKNSPSGLKKVAAAKAAAASKGAVAKVGSKAAAYSLQDPRAVTKALRAFTPKGNNREKLVAIVDEMIRLKIPKHPISFCFLLRSAFEISSKAFGKDNPSIKISKDGRDRPLVDILRDITSHLTSNKKDQAKVKLLHGALTQLAKTDGILSVTSMNQLVHNPRFSVSAGDISALFANVFPLLEEMNS